MYVTSNSLFSVTKMRSQQTHAHATNIIYTVTTVDWVLTNTSVDCQAVLNQNQLQ